MPDNAAVEPGGERQLVMLSLPLSAEVFKALSDVAHDEGHSIELQAQRAIEEMLRARKRRPLFD